jgi:hypothetical protein
MSSPTAISITPNSAENAVTLMNPYTQPMSGLFATIGRIPSAS